MPIDPTELLGRLTLGVRAYQAHAELDGQPLRKLADPEHCSRGIFAVPDAPYVVKVQFGYHPKQSWNEWWFWHHHVDGSDLSHLFAATHAVRVEACLGPHGEKHTIVACVQERVFDGMPATRDIMRQHSATESYLAIREGFPRLADIKDREQYVFDAERGHYRLVDYGIHAPALTYNYDEYERLGDGAWDRAISKVGITEKALVLGA